MNTNNSSSPVQADSAADQDETVQELAEENNESGSTDTAGDVKSIVIKAENPSEDEMKAICAAIAAKYPAHVELKSVQYNFKKSKDKDTGIETVREALQLAVPYPSVAGIIDILEKGGKQLELLQDAMKAVVDAQVRELINDDTTLNAATLPMDKLMWEYIANLPKAQRGGGIPKETWEAFGKDYCEVMPAVTGKTLEQVANAAKILVGKLNAVKTNEPVLNLLLNQLAIYMDKSPNAEEYQACVQFLLEKADSYLNVSEEELLAKL